MAEIVKVYQEHFPCARLIGKKYTMKDGGSQGYAHKWDEWFENGWFEQLEKIGRPADLDNGYIGLMRCNMADADNTFEYWIGIFFQDGTAVPEGYSCADLPESDVAVCWIQGKLGPELYQMHEACAAQFGQHGFSRFRSDSEKRVCFFERYNCPRYTQPDENGLVILDYGVYLED